MNAAIILQILHLLQAGLQFLTQRGLTRDRVLELLDKAEAEGRDLTTAEVQAELDQLQAELDETADRIEDLNGG